MSHPIQHGRLDHVVLRCRDITAMRAFYTTVLGCPEERVLEDLGLYQLRAGASLIDLVDCTAPLGEQGGAAPGSTGHNMDHLCLQLRAWDEPALRQHLADHGVATEPASQRYGADGTGASIYLSDPEGNTVELKAPPQGTP